MRLINQGRAPSGSSAAKLFQLLGSDEKYMNRLKSLLMLGLFAAVCSCSKMQEPDSIFVAEDGTRYTVLARQDMHFNGDRMFVVRYISSNPRDPETRSKEFEDLYSIIANNIDPKSTYDYVALEAVDKPNPELGINKTSGYRDRRPLSEVIALRN